MYNADPSTPTSKQTREEKNKQIWRADKTTNRPRTKRALLPSLATTHTPLDHTHTPPHFTTATSHHTFPHHATPQNTTPQPAHKHTTITPHHSKVPHSTAQPSPEQHNTEYCSPSPQPMANAARRRSGRGGVGPLRVALPLIQSLQVEKLHHIGVIPQLCVRNETSQKTNNNASEMHCNPRTRSGWRRFQLKKIRRARGRGEQHVR